MDKEIRQAVAQVIDKCAERGTYQAAKYLSPTIVVRASRRLQQGKLPPYNSSTFEVLVIIGKPNFEQRAFIKRLKKTKGKFPVLITREAPKRK